MIDDTHLFHSLNMAGYNVVVTPLRSSISQQAPLVFLGNDGQ